MSLDALLHPSSIAIIGASTRPQTMSGRPLELLRQHGFTGRIYPVNVHAAEIGGLRAYPSVSHIGEPVDVALVVVPAAHVLDVLRECAESGVQHAIVVSAGFGEGGGEEGARAEREIANIVESSGMRVMGPNAQGLFDVVNAVPVTFSPLVDLERGLAEFRAGPVAIVSQSGGLGYSLFHWGSLSSMGFSQVVATGNEVDLDCLEVVDALLDQADTKVVLLVLEGFRHPERLAGVARKARSLGKHLVVSKLGRGDAGQRATVSHTAHLAGSDAAYQAAFARYGVFHASDQDELLDLGAALPLVAPMRGRRVGIVTTSGGTGVWLADAMEAEGLSVPELPAVLQKELEAVMPPYGSTKNPIDLTAQVVSNGGFASALEVLLAGDAVDAVVIVMALSRAAVLERERDELERVLAGATVPVVLYSRTKPSTDSVEVLDELGLPWLTTPRRVARLLSALAEAGVPKVLPPDPDAGLDETPFIALPQAPVTEASAKAFLADHGLPVPAGRLVTDADAAADAADSFGYPVAMKLQSAELPHKTELGLVELGIGDHVAARAAFAQLVERAATAAPEAAVEGVLVEAMASPGVEMIVGVVRDEDFGPLVMLGTGGIHAEILRDTVFSLAPFDQSEAARMVDSLRGLPLLTGARGAEHADRRALEVLLVTVSRLAHAHRDDLGELDLNPVFVHPDGHGVTVVDAWLAGRNTSTELHQEDVHE